MLETYKKQREEQRATKFNMPTQSAQMRIMNAFQIGQKPQTPSHLRMPSFGGDLGNFSETE